MSSITAAAKLLLLTLCMSWTTASSLPPGYTNKICPILGPSFPKPFNIASQPAFAQKSEQLDAAINKALQSGLSAYGEPVFNTSTFSIGVFNAKDDGLSYQKHFTDAAVQNSTVGVNSVDADTIYRIGSGSKVFTVLGFLSKIGFHRWYDPITSYLPAQLFQPSEHGNISTGALPQWCDITIGDLASQSSGMSRDFGLSERALPFPTWLGGPLEGFPPLPASQIPSCAYIDAEDRFHTCTVEFINGISTQPAAWAAVRTPSYSNSAYSLLALIAENITGLSMTEIFDQTISKPLNLQHTFYDYPVDSSLGAIPYNTTASGWDSVFGIAAAAGGNFANTNDFATIGKAIMNNILLSTTDTRRWLRPITFQAGITAAVGAPWEITRWQTPNRVYDIYAKDGGLVMYASLFILVPDLNFGFSILEVDGTEPDATGSIKYALADLILEHLLPAVEDIAREQAAAKFAGTYEGSPNSTVVVDTDEQPGLRVTKWISNGTDLLAEIGGSVPGQTEDMRLWPNELYQGNEVGFTATFNSLPRAGLGSPLSDCNSWGGVDEPTYGNVAVGHVVFGLDESSGKATSVRLEALRRTLQRVQ